MIAGCLSVIAGMCKRQKRRTQVNNYESSDEVDEREFFEELANNRQRQRRRNNGIDDDDNPDGDLFDRINNNFRGRTVDRIRQIVEESQQRREFINRLEQLENQINVVS